MNSKMSDQTGKLKVLLVDDDVNILNGYKRTLRKKFTVVTAQGGAEALEILRTQGEIPLVVSDMRMPEMDGLQLLEEVKKKYPDMMRAMLTGNADQETAIEAINRGQIFRFHTKPCLPEQLALTITDANEHYRLKKVEQDLLENTLRGTIRALTEVLSLVNPEAFGRTTRITNLTVSIAKVTGMKDVWFLESLAMLSQIGCIILPDDVLHTLYAGHPFNEEQRQLYEMHPGMGADVIGKVPRMERMAKSIQYQMKNYDGTGIPTDSLKGKDIPIGARILHVVIDFDGHMETGISEQQAYEKLVHNKRWYDPNVLKSLHKVLSTRVDLDVHKVTVKQLLVGMTIAEDVTSIGGVLIVNKGQKVTATLLERIGVFSRLQRLAEPISVTPQED